MFLLVVLILQGYYFVTYHFTFLLSTNFCSVVSVLFIIVSVIPCISYKASIIASGCNTLAF